MKKLMFILFICLVGLGSCGKRKSCETAKSEYNAAYKEYTEYVENNYNGDTPNEAYANINNYKDEIKRLEKKINDNCKD